MAKEPSRIKRRERKNITSGVAHVNASFNNTMVTITDAQGNMPCSAALRPASSAATWAAYGVDLREPLKPMVPDDDQEIALPWTSVMVIMVLLNVAWTCATPFVMFFRSRRRMRVSFFAIGPYFFLPAMAFAGPLRVRALVCVR